MIVLWKHLWPVAMLAADTGAGDGGGDGSNAGSDASSSSQAGAEGGEDKGGEAFDPATKLDSKVVAKYISQLSKEYQADDFKGIEDINSLYKGYKKYKEQAEKSEDIAKDDRYIRIPTPDSSIDEIKEFYTKIGMPQEKDGYSTPNLELDEVVADVLSKNFREAAWRSGLSKKQGEVMWANLAATYQAFSDMTKKKVEKLKDTVDSRYSDLLKDDIPDETRRKDRIAEEKNAVKAFGEETGLSGYFEKTGLSLNPNFMHSLAEWYTKIKPLSIFSSGAGTERKKHGLESIYRD